MRLLPDGRADAVDFPAHGDGGAVEDARVPHQFADGRAGDVLAGEQRGLLEVEADVLGLAAEIREELADLDIRAGHLSALDRVAVCRPDDAAVYARVDCHDEMSHGKTL
ncbi:MAG: hypothetical protein AN484_15375 [Aphanizomenon flos-aquae WA102]|uniref:Uncharacterized protein n=1 Tax=Aphanizomenon flos-aquae WA102 TaxID=1710896 RepID=A0A1B7X0G7_APHFL|nr:MAG: hypothetical protein AN484_15375 [Aphanizomenon flos-aquae WA102]